MPPGSTAQAEFEVVSAFKARIDHHEAPQKSAYAANLA
jgi:hypothetical protein